MKHETPTNPWVIAVKEFNDTYNLHVVPFNGSSHDMDELLLDLIDEENDELQEAVENCDPAEIMDALGDLLVTVIGAAYRWDFPIEEIFRRVHESNMSKLGEDGKPIYREDGKLLKGPNFAPPNFDDIVDDLI